MEIKLKQLTLENFKGIKNLDINFSDKTNISGANATGKTTIFDGFTWLLFGKDSHDVKDFGIKPLDKKGNTIHKLESSVTGQLSIDGAEETLRRTYREKWTRRRGEEASTLTGHETIFFWNDVPLQAQEFKAKVDELVSESLFKLLTSTLYFNSLKWQDRRRALIQIAGEISQDDILAGMPKGQAADIMEILNSGKPLEDFRKETSMRKKKLNDELRQIPSRVDEVGRGMPIPQDFEAMDKLLIKDMSILEEVEKAIIDKVAAYDQQSESMQGVQGEIYELRKKKSQMEYDTDEDFRKAKREQENQRSAITQKLQDAERKRDLALTNIQDLKTTKVRFEASITETRDMWAEISKVELVTTDDEFNCPTCLQPFKPEEAAKILEEMKTNHASYKAKQLADITQKGTDLGANLKRVTGEIDEYKEEIAELSVIIESMNEDLQVPVAELPKTEDLGSNVQYKIIIKDIEKLELSLVERPKMDVDSLKEQKVAAQAKIEETRYALTKRDGIARCESRIKELLAEEKSLAQQISDLEKKEFAIDAYTRVNMTTVESRVNGKFKLVKWRMFNTLINGSVEESCECTVGGVPYHDINSAGKIKAGVDIINTLGDHYGIYCPIFSDNAESINEIPETKSQLIRLVVTKDQSLIVT